MMIETAILDLLPYSKPFLFVDQLSKVSEEGIEGSYTFPKDLPFYEGHFKGNPVTPGAILTECCAQIGVVSLGIYLINGKFQKTSQIALTSSEMEFLKPVYPGETVTVTSKKIYFRFGKLKCKTKMTDQKGNIICKGTIAGIITT